MAHKYAHFLKMLTDAMDFKLSHHKKKGKLESPDFDMSLDQVIRLLRDEVDELEEAIDGGNTVEITLEAADVANYAMFAIYMAYKMASKPLTYSASDVDSRGVVRPDAESITGVEGVVVKTLPRIPPESLTTIGHRTFMGPKKW